MWELQLFMRLKHTIFYSGTDICGANPQTAHSKKESKQLKTFQRLKTAYI